MPWKNDSFNLYNNKCDITNSSNKNIIHHHKNFSDIVKEVLNTLNLEIKYNLSEYSELDLKLIEKLSLELHYKYGLGICISQDEHKLFHKIYGKKNNTKEQYDEFKANRTIKLNTD